MVDDNVNNGERDDDERNVCAKKQLGSLPTVTFADT